jgi:hypothetical protein
MAETCLVLLCCVALQVSLQPGQVVMLDTAAAGGQAAMDGLLDALMAGDTAKLLGGVGSLLVSVTTVLHCHFDMGFRVECYTVHWTRLLLILAAERRQAFVSESGSIQSHACGKAARSEPIDAPTPGVFVIVCARSEPIDAPIPGVFVIVCSRSEPIDAPTPGVFVIVCSRSEPIDAPIPGVFVIVCSPLCCAGVLLEGRGLHLPSMTAETVLPFGDCTCPTLVMLLHFECAEVWQEG